MRVLRFRKNTDNRNKRMAPIQCNNSTIFMLVYNFQRKHMTLGTTPAIKAGIADHVWTIEEIIGLLEAREQKVA